MIISNNQIMILKGILCISHDKWVTVTMLWCMLRLWMKDWPPLQRVAINILNKQLQKANK